MSKRDKAAGFGQGLTIGERPALIVVDFVKAYLEPSSPLYAGVEDVRDVCVEMLNAARDHGVPVFHTCVRFTPGGADGGIFYRKLPLLRVFDSGSPLGAFGRGLAPQGDECVIVKQYASAFFGTSLAGTLTAQGIDTLIVTGVTTSGCIRATAVDAMQHGFVPIVVEDAVGDRDEAPHKANLFDLQAKYAQIMTSREVIAHFAGATGSTD